MKTSEIRLKAPGAAVLAILMGLLGFLPGGIARAQPADHSFLEERPEPVSGKPALTEKKMKQFLKVNAKAEPLRLKVIQENLIDPPSARAQSPGSMAAGSGGISRDSTLREVMEFAFAKVEEVDREACAEADLEFSEFGEMLLRISQVRQLIEMERELANTRQRLARLPAKDAGGAGGADELNLMTEEEIRPLYESERHGLETDVASLEKQIEDAKANDAKAESLRAEGIQKRDGRNKGKIKKYREQIDQMSRIEANYKKTLEDPRFAAQRSQIEADITKVATAKERIQKKLDRLLRSDAKRLPASSRRAAHMDGLEKRLTEAHEGIADLDARWESGEFNRVWSERNSEMAGGQREGLLDRQEGYETFLHSDPMRQAELDRKVILRHRKRLVYLDESLLGDPRPVRLGSQGLFRGIAH